MWKLFSRDSGQAGPDLAAGGEGVDRTSGYDRVAVLDEGEIRWMSARQFQELTLTERVRLLASGDLRFYRGAAQIAPSEAMRGLP
jgi:hypothetical protein